MAPVEQGGLPEAAGNAVGWPGVKVDELGHGGQVGVGDPELQAVAVALDGQQEPGARLYGLRGGSFSDYCAAWDWCVTHQDDDPDNPILIINCSNGLVSIFGHEFGYTEPCDGEYPSLSLAAANATAAGITIFAAAGNAGYVDKLAIPACLTDTISVGGVFYHTLPGYHISDEVVGTSNSAEFLDLLAPGEVHHPRIFGTSAAAPYAAGAAALLIEAARVAEVSLTPAQVGQALVTTGDPSWMPSRTSGHRGSTSLR